MSEFRGTTHLRGLAETHRDHIHTAGQLNAAADEIDRLRAGRAPSENARDSLIACLRARIAELEAERAWRPIAEAPRDGRLCLFFGPGRRGAGNENARDAYMRVDLFSHLWPNGKHQYPEAPYTHWQPLPPPPAPEGNADAE